jgi:hypothetical protein
MSELAIAEEAPRRWHDLWESKLRASQPATPILLPVPTPEFSQVVTTYGEILAALRDCANQLDISRGTIDSIAGIADGLASKILAVGQLKRLGVESLPAVVQALGLRITIEHDDETYERVRHQYIKRDGPHTIAATKGHAGTKEAGLSRVAARAALLQAAEDARVAHKNALVAIRAAEAAAVKAARMKAARLQEKLKRKRTPRK